MEEKVYTIPKGKVLFKKAGDTNWWDFGSCQDLPVSVTVDTKEHPDQRSGIGGTDQIAYIKKKGLAKPKFDDVKSKNLQMFLMAGVPSSIVQAASTVADQDITAELDRWIELSKKKLSSVVVGLAALPAVWESSQVYALSAFVSKVAGNDYRYECTTAGTSGASEPTWPTTVGDTVIDGTVVWTCRKTLFVVDVDYKLDIEVGLLMPLSDGGILEDDALHVSYDYAAITTTKYDAGMVNTLEGDLWFISNAGLGKIFDIKGYAALKPTGDLSLISANDDYISMDFEATFLTGHYTGLFEVEERGVITP